jgi:hypothetical protein
MNEPNYFRRIVKTALSSNQTWKSGSQVKDKCTSSIVQANVNNMRLPVSVFLISSDERENDIDGEDDI